MSNRWQEAEQFLRDKDPVLGGLIERYGPCTLSPRKNLFDFLCESIIWQQISIKVAVSIMERFRSLFSKNQAEPEELLNLSNEDLREVGVSQRKIIYLKNLAKKIVDGELDLFRLRELSNEKIEDELLKLKGIGPWTVTMFLIFALNRTNVLPIGDLGIKKAIQIHYNLPELPRPDKIREIARAWHPYESIASWYLWQSLRNKD
ncbi:hypothetical protein BBF96_01120 [Anoxybacter fermentans]|uniref:DNA-3-methyladenine glycosylase II n=1 Tax=Anoxybacter fermentans TaxID=1323375 RepID=A0A3S9SV16_9FIRM|nr:DNA-3-methyladenine glycosylase [Anoxybacter fermentans]AZR72114.1 hypothetical protein BBF96_01120 [Anoxybacter fermentans]